MVTIRKRNKASIANVGMLKYRREPGEPTITSYEYDRGHCEDVLGNRNGANYFYSDQYHYHNVGNFSGTVEFFPVYTFTNWPYFIQLGDSGSVGHEGAQTTPPSITEAITSVASRTNPSKPEVSLPVFIAQLKELPKSLRDVGLTKIGKKGRRDLPNNQAVGFNFGWDLLFKDLFTMLDFTSQVDARVKQLNAAHSRSGSRGHKGVWNENHMAEYDNVQVWSADVSIYIDRRSYNDRSMWGSIRWIGDHVDAPSASDTLQTARYAVHGWRLAPADAWELVPWSWLIDYFANIGDYLEATQNSVGVHGERGCVMTMTRSHFIDRIRSVSSNRITVVPMSLTRITRERVPADPGLSFRGKPLLGPKQLVTLSSIIANMGHYL